MLRLDEQRAILDFQCILLALVLVVIFVADHTAQTLSLSQLSFTNDSRRETNTKTVKNNKQPHHKK